MRPWSKNRLLLSILIPSAIAVVVISSIVFIFKTGADRDLLRVHEQKQVDTNHARIVVSLRGIVSDLQVIAETTDLHLSLDTDNPVYRNYVAREFMALSAYKRVYDQVRLIDDSGMEVVRVNFNGGAPAVVAEKELQNKGDRYYFKGVMALERGGVYFSPLDLNMEKGRIEEPRKPVIRLGMPVYDKSERKRGAVMFNYLASELLADPPGDDPAGLGALLVANSDGFWLRGLSVDEEWGFMYEGREAANIKYRFPEAAARIYSGYSGQFITPEGLFTFRTVRPVEDGMMRGNAGAEHKAPGSGDRYWKIISYVSPGALVAGSRAYLRRVIAVDGVLIVIVAVGAWFIAGAMDRQRLAEMMARESEQRYQLLAKTARDAIVSTNGLRTIVSWNRGATEIFGYSEAEVLGRQVTAIIPERSLEDYTRAISELHEDTEDLVGRTTEMYGIGKDGREFPIELSAATWKEGDARFYSLIVRDTTERRKMEEMLERLATTDKLTGAYNRAKFDEVITHEIEVARRFENGLSLAIFDLDGFKHINDDFGHHSGDHALKTLAAIVRERARATDYIFRWGGDEFVLLCPQTGAGEARELCERLRKAIEEHGFDPKWGVTSTFGVTGFRPDDTADSFVKRADETLYKAKAEGKNRVRADA